MGNGFHGKERQVPNGIGHPMERQQFHEVLSHGKHFSMEPLPMNAQGNRHHMEYDAFYMENRPPSMEKRSWNSMVSMGLLDWAVGVQIGSRPGPDATLLAEEAVLLALAVAMSCPWTTCTLWSSSSSTETIPVASTSTSATTTPGLRHRHLFLPERRDMPGVAHATDGVVCGEQRAPRRWRRDAAWSRPGVLALLYVGLLAGSWTQLALAAALPARPGPPPGPPPGSTTDASSARRYPWTFDNPQQSAVPPPPQRRPAAPMDGRTRPRPSPGPPPPAPATAGSLAPAAGRPRSRGFSQSSLTGGGGGGGRARGGGGGGGGGGGAWCASEDVGSRAYASTTVFEGKARSRSAPGPGGSYFVTFVVQHVRKDAPSGAVGGGAVAAPPLRMRSQVRLQFVEPPLATTPAPGPERPRAAARHAAECEDMSRLAPSAAPVRASIRPGGKFIVFADRVGPHNFTVRGAPVPRSRASVHAIRTVLCPDCVAMVMLDLSAEITWRRG
ncbi:Oxygen-evolving enhancer protein 3-1, chloroplastic [Frankliniella fusca]|uniref:Oxygen-evolving enhancer protein 3-1, chloroplastic n=1 Tax=Frankliniella fusca TaxID=407009 RepID=A0AAE1I278_9NEOP|nr:Oxygen-evolving enhancer protein 3-1, chloroplastic [Frankliniella fusca]